ncbi:hypothetical protein BDV30DRAFT_208821 [Aspergillus minisclerotigenes]|uniref:Uncharacterized protein n=1 Tax=Aspergillus minisclerotigenes TaxID=656917 RepID=A0A5N6J7G4_9EURO|nr:hypothetical protein BDV30DRAFT_208821 [Aspergillus minisclerotigenes]
MREITAVPMIPEQKDFDQRSGAIHSESAQGRGDDEVAHDSDDEPMVYVTPRDYATSARQERDRLIAEGADPDSVILQSEVRNHVPRREGESPADFAKRYCETMKAMMSRGVSILNDMCTADMFQLDSKPKTEGSSIWARDRMRRRGSFGNLVGGSPK